MEALKLGLYTGHLSVNAEYCTEKGKECRPRQQKYYTALLFTVLLFKYLSHFPDQLPTLSGLIAICSDCSPPPLPPPSPPPPLLPPPSTPPFPNYLGCPHYQHMPLCHCYGYFKDLDFIFAEQPESTFAEKRKRQALSWSRKIVRVFDYFHSVK